MDDDKAKTPRGKGRKAENEKDRKAELPDGELDKAVGGIHGVRISNFDLDFVWDPASQTHVPREP